MDIAANDLYARQMAEYDAQTSSSSNSTSQESLSDYLESQNSEAELNYYAELSAANDVGEFRQRISNLLIRFGITDFAFVRLDCADDIDSQALVTIPQKLTNSYIMQGFHEYDVIVPHGENNLGGIYHSTVLDYLEHSPFDNDITRTMQAISDLNKKYRFYDYYNVSAKSFVGSGNVMLSVTQRGCSPFMFKPQMKSRELAIKAICETIDYIATHKFPSILGGVDTTQTPVFSINPKPLRVLETLANNDLSIAQVAERLSISVVTANKHLETARRVFETKTTYAAIRKAVVNGLFKYEK